MCDTIAAVQTWTQKKIKMRKRGNRFLKFKTITLFQLNFKKGY